MDHKVEEQVRKDRDQQLKKDMAVYEASIKQLCATENELPVEWVCRVLHPSCNWTYRGMHPKSALSLAQLAQKMHAEGKSMEETKAAIEALRNPQPQQVAEVTL